VGTEHGIVEAIKEIENVTLAIEEEMLVSSALSSYLAAKVRKGHMTHNAIEPSSAIYAVYTIPCCILIYIALLLEVCRSRSIAT